MKTKYIKQKQKIKPTFRLFENNQPRTDLTTREILMLEEHPEYERYISSIKENLNESKDTNNEILLDDYSNLLDRMKSPRLLDENELNHQEIDKTIKQATFLELFETLSNTDENDFTDLFGEIHQVTENRIRHQIADELDTRVENLLESDKDDVRMEILNGTKRFITETEISFFIKQDIIKSLLSTDLFFDKEKEIRDYLKEEEENIQEIRNSVQSKSNTYYQEVKEALSGLHAVNEPQITESMSRTQIDQELLLNEQDLLFQQVQSFIKVKKLQEKKQRELLESKTPNEDIEVLKNTKKIEETSIFENYPHIIKSIQTFEDKVFNTLKISKDYQEKHMDSIIEKEMCKIVSLDDIEKIEETFPITKFLDKNNPMSLTNSYFIVKDVQNTKEYKDRKKVILDKLSKENKEGKETVFRNKDNIEVYDFQGYTYFLHPQKDFIEYEIVFNPNQRKTELGIK